MTRGEERKKADILVVDDEPDVARIIALNLQFEGFDVRIAHNGREALEEVSRRPPDCILLDIMMPVMDGWDVLKALKSDRATSDIPVVVVTARHSDVDRIRGYSGGAVEYITKPFDPETLKDYVARVLEPRHSKVEEEIRRDRIKGLQVSTLYRITETLISTLEIDDILGFITGELLKLFDLDLCCIGLFEGENGSLRIASACSAPGLEGEGPAKLDLEPRRLEELVREERGDAASPRRVEPGDLLTEGEAGLLDKLEALFLLPLKVKGRITGAFLLGRSEDLLFSEEEAELLAAIGNQAAMAIENARLYDDLRYDEEVQRQLLQKVITAQEDERRRVAVELHDGVIQNLVSALYRLRLCAVRMGEADPEAASALQEAERIMDGSISEMRRIVAGLRPSVLDDLGLEVALEKHVAQLQEKAGCHIILETAQGGLPPLTLEAETALYRIAQEAVNNVLKHSRCNQAKVSLRVEGDTIVLEITDDGVGFDASGAQRRFTAGFGLVGMRERAESLGGSLEIRSGRGKGTSVVTRLPLRGIAGEV
ncbi:MAG: response regulator [Actinobacteria bacterium]|nr:response regulator [Actinomycetota bacterium]